MHMLFTPEEMEWCRTDMMGWPVKEGCPDDIKQSIEKKKLIIKNQFEDDGDKTHNVSRILQEQTTA